jgi:GT2 family glycosyltransferase
VVKTAVVIVCWNNETLLEGCLDSVSAQTIPCVAYLVDNGSADGSVALVRSKYPWVRVVEVGWNSGFAHANNVGIAAAFEDADVDGVVLLNSDARLAADWISVVTSFAHQRPRGATFQALTLDYSNRDVVDSHHLYLARSLHAMQFGTGVSLAPSGLDESCSERVFGVNAAACLYTRAFLEAQPFDEYLDSTMFMYLEDVDLALRAIMMGWESWYVEGTRAYHIGSASTAQRVGGFALFQTWRNQPVLLLSNLPWSLLVRGLVGLLWHEVGAVRHLRATGQAPLVRSLVRGRLSGLRLIPHALRRRRQLAPFVVADAEHVWSLMRDGRSIR